jgi:serine/threonine-protein kinase
MQQEQIVDGRYRLIEQLGVGGMAVVWKAHDELLNRHVAVKILAGPTTASPAARRRVQAEAQAAAQVWHPNVTNVYDYGEAIVESGRHVPYVVMELLPGRTLSQRLAVGPLPPRAALRICAEVADALAAAHDRNLVHRDVKPDNVMLTPTGAKVVDFGLAAVTGQPDIDEEGQLLGTAAYLAPERLTGDEVLAASDVYALGLLIHRALTNTLPWQADTPSQMLNAHVYVEPDPLPPISGVPAAVNEICNRCLAKDPADRPAAAEVAAVLAKAAGIVPLPSDDFLEPAVLPSRTPGIVAVADRSPAPVAAAPDADAPDPVAAGARTGVGGTGTASDPRAGMPPGRRAVAILAGVAAIAAVATVVALTMFGALSDGSGSTAAPAAPATSPSVSAGPAALPTSGPTANPTVPAGGPGQPGSLINPASPGPPVSASAAPTSPTPEPGFSVSGYGGEIRVVCNGKKAQSIRLTVNPGYTVDNYMPGPADEVKAVLISAVNKSEIKVKCVNGAPAASVKETPVKP